jgi:hypothetical protein
VMMDAFLLLCQSHQLHYHLHIHTSPRTWHVPLRPQGTERWWWR